MKTAKRFLVVTAVGLLLAGAAPLVAAQVVALTPSPSRFDPVCFP